MIRKIEVKNYKSLKNVDLEMRRRNILVGPNMAGKSTLLDCFRFLTQMCISGVNTAFLNRGGFSEVVWKGEDNGPISFRLVIEHDADQKESEKSYDYEIAINGSPTGLISVEKEHLSVEKDGQTSTLLDLRHGQGKVMHASGAIAFVTEDPTRSALEFSVPGWEGMEIKNELATWRFYRLLPALMKQPNAVVAQKFLTENGENFSSWFMTLQTNYPDEFRLVKQTACDVFPALKEILTPPTQFATTFVITMEKYFKRPITLGHMSDGEIAFLAWLSLIFSPSALGAPLFCIEELENHLHPKLLETLVEVLNQKQKELGSQAAQIIVTTHSPYLVDKVELDDLIVVEKSDGATRCTRPSSKSHLKELLEREELGLGELWYSGALSGN
ncbi:MAG TPA: AAA family ATPase [Thermodesulfovibrionales bacterium]|nr:AAA family ATPase [Thermodesulfovibrionales bacterium]